MPLEFFDPTGIANGRLPLVGEAQPAGRVKQGSAGLLPGWICFLRYRGVTKPRRAWRVRRQPRTEGFRLAVGDPIWGSIPRGPSKGDSSLYGRYSEWQSTRRNDANRRNSLSGVEQPGQLASFISWRSQVQILVPLLKKGTGMPVQRGKRPKKTRRVKTSKRTRPPEKRTRPPEKKSSQRRRRPKRISKRTRRAKKNTSRR